MTQLSVYQQLGAETIKRLVDNFYSRVEQDPLLRPLFPEDLEPGKQAQYLFLVQYFGGPDLYNQQRGHPMLRARHLPFTIGQPEREHWLNHMLTAIEELDLPEPSRSVMQDYFQRASTHMINQTPPGQQNLRIVGPSQRP